MRRGSTPLPDGRRLGWAEWGPEDGAPVLYCPGAGCSAALRFGEEAAARLGARIVGLDRPGLGRSDPLPGRTFASWIDDVRALVAARDLHAPRSLGFSQGGPFALALAAEGVVGACALVAPTDELAAPHLRALLDEQVRDLVDRTAADPVEVEAWLGGMTSAMLHHYVLSSTAEVDREVLGAVELDAIYRGALEEGFSRGPEGYARDTILAMQPWPFDVARTEARVDVWCGALDASPVHSPDRGRSLARRLPRARHHVVAGAGTVILWTHAEAILAALLEG